MQAAREAPVGTRFGSIDVVEGQSDVRPAPIPMFLALRAIREALEGG